ncbi:DNA polymerase IV [Catenovulum sediminis]|uniref:DNA polymerase IV n=1 Tax=Catenovulum sediminis TaxID=1740262 RepID=UPI001180E420|nr:DNA polymerase IV [Catenovulum sediminis]
MRKIIHIDMDCFFAAVEMRENPELKDIPIAVGGRADRRGVIATCNYPARTYGVRSAMATSYALKLCPVLKIVPGNMDLYKSISRQIQQIFNRYTELIEPLSLDEAYLDVTDSKLYCGSATLIANAIRRDIFNETGLTASAGVAPNKFLAKIASEENKPNGIYVVSPDRIKDFVACMALQKLHGVGKATLEKLHALNLYTTEDIRNADPQFLFEKFGRFAEGLIRRSHGQDDRPVETQRIRKSIGVEHTYAKDLTEYTQGAEKLADLYNELGNRFSRISEQYKVVKLGVKLKFNDFNQTTMETTCQLQSFEVFSRLLQQVWQERARGRKVRLLGLSYMLEPIQDAYRPEQLSLNFA